MSGHSKWNNIKNRKGKEDAKRAQEFTKIARYIMVAAKNGGSNPEFNPSLKSAVDKAKSVNMPNDNIERAIKKGAGELEGVNYEEIFYEGYGPEGVALLVQCLTDNRNRTAADVRHIFDKHGGNLGTTGCVSYMFHLKGYLAVEIDEGVDPDALMLTAIDAGAEDVTGDEEVAEIYTEPKQLDAVAEALEAAGFSIAAREIGYFPENENAVSEKGRASMEKLIDALEENDDVQEVFHNMEG